MRYAVLLYDDEQKMEALSPEESEALMAQHGQYGERVAELGGTVLGGEALQSTAKATSVRWNADEVTVSEGPYAETAEQFGGFYTVELPDLDAAIEAVKVLPHHAELRPVVVHDMPAGEVPAVDGELHVVLLYGDEEPWLRATPDEREAMYAQHGRFSAAVVERGAAVAGGEELAHSSTATTVRRTPDGIVISDGPFAETTEQLTGFYLIRAKGVDVVVDLLNELPGEVTEIRPVVDMSQSPA
jgi:hypothetical protein